MKTLTTHPGKRQICGLHAEALRAFLALILAVTLSLVLIVSHAQAQDILTGYRGTVQGYQTEEAGQDAGSRLTAASLYAADVLAANLASKAVPKGAILAASLVHQNDFTKTCALGRLVAHQAATRLAQYGYPVAESRVRASMAIQPSSGEFLLSRDLAKLAARETGAVAALLGTYLPTETEVYVSLRFVSLQTGATLGASEFVLANSGAVRRLLGGEDNRNAWARHASRAPAFAQPASAPAMGFGDNAAPAAISSSSVAAPLFDAPAGTERAVTLQIYFDSSSAILKDEQARQDLVEIASAMNSAQLLGAGFEIGGHTDSTGSARYNQGLSRRRAEAVKMYLERQGVDGTRLTTQGYGETQPVADNTTEDGKAQNRRVVIKRMN